VEFCLSAAQCTVEAAVLSRTSKAAVEQIERFLSFPQLPARSKRAIGSPTMKAIRAVATRINALPRLWQPAGDVPVLSNLSSIYEKV
jgi:hypothetical protein